MKKLVSILMVLAMIAALSVTAFAAFDLSSNSDEEILELQVLVQEEIVKRGIKKTATLTEGLYIAGEDIPVGKYDVRCYNEEGYGESVYVYDNYEEHNLVGKYSVKYDEEFADFYIALREGNVLCVDSKTELTVTTGVAFN